jgi:hypothetical protein
MKTLIFLLLGLQSTQLVAQYTITSFSMNTINLESGDIVSSEDRTETYNISFKDKLFIHNIFDSETNSSSNSQLYKIISIKEEGDMTYFTTESGLSGNNYTFILKVDAEKIQFFQYFDEEELIEFKGNSSGFKTFNQD